MDTGTDRPSHTHSNDHDAHDHTHDGHGHGHGADKSSRALAVVAALNLIGFLAELAGGLLFGSVALISDAIHMLFDALAYVMAFAASYIAERYDTSASWSYGLHRLEPLAAFLNGILLIPMVGYILYEAYHRFLTPANIGTGPTLAIAAAGLLINLVSVVVLHDGEMSLNEKGAFYHLLGDAGGSIAVIISVIVIEVTGLTVIDPVIAALIAVVIIWSAGKVLRGSGAIFFHRTALDSEHVCDRIEAIDGVDTVDDFHAWQICSQITVATLHVETSVDTMADGEAITAEIHDVLADRGVDHATVELCPSYAARQTHLNAHEH